MELRTDRVVAVMILLILVLFVLSGAGQVARHVFGYPSVLGLVDFFDLNQEVNPPTLYQAVALLVTSMAAATLAHRERELGSRWWRHWAGIAIIFLYLSVDEGAGLHEAMIDPLQRVIGIPDAAWAPTWVIVALPAAALVAVLLLPWFFSYLRPRERVWTVVSGLLFVGGAVGMEMLSAHIVFAEGYDPDHQLRPVHAILSHVEELMEMLSVVAFIHVPLNRLRNSTSVNIRFG